MAIEVNRPEGANDFLTYLAGEIKANPTPLLTNRVVDERGRRDVLGELIFITQGGGTVPHIEHQAEVKLQELTGMSFTHMALLKHVQDNMGADIETADEALDQRDAIADLILNPRFQLSTYYRIFDLGEKIEAVPFFAKQELLRRAQETMLTRNIPRVMPNPNKNYANLASWITTEGAMRSFIKDKQAEITKDFQEIPDTKPVIKNFKYMIGRRLRIFLGLRNLASSAGEEDMRGVRQISDLFLNQSFENELDEEEAIAFRQFVRISKHLNDSFDFGYAVGCATRELYALPTIRMAAGSSGTPILNIFEGSKI